jgi:hypothetical protein
MRNATTGRSNLLWLVPACMTAHNFEEALTFPSYLPLVLERMPDTWRSIAGPVTLGQVWAALAGVTLIPFMLAAWATLRPHLAAPVWLLLVIQATLLLNVLWHVIAALVLFGGYAPGLGTAVLLNVPVSILLLRRAAKENWVSARARWALPPTAIVVHGPLLSGLLLLTERL